MVNNKIMIVYKYRPVDKYTLELLINNELYFSFPEDFNDPFDSNIPIDFSNISNEDFKLWIERVGNESDNSFLRKIDIEKIPSEHWEKIKLKFNEVNESKFLYCCFSTINEYNINNNVLLWSHYANCHKGISLGFESNNLEGMDGLEFDEQVFFAQENPRYPNHGELCEMSYTKELIPFNYITDSNEKYSNIIFSKGMQWDYENEYRIMVRVIDFSEKNGLKKNIKFSKKILKEVIFGLKCSIEDKKTIRSIIKDKGYDVKFFKCERKKNEYGLDIIPID